MSGKCSKYQFRRSLAINSVISKFSSLCSRATKSIHPLLRNTLPLCPLPPSQRRVVCSLPLSSDGEFKEVNFPVVQIWGPSLELLLNSFCLSFGLVVIGHGSSICGPRALRYDVRVSLLSYLTIVIYTS
jgi:hypothetical protein